MKISLIVPTYNRVDFTVFFLRRIIDYHQSELHEVIFSDDGSAEDIITPICRLGKELDIGCKIVIQEHKGYRLARVRNNGVRHSSGDYICFLDQDLIPCEGYFRQIKHYAKPGRFLITRPVYTTPEEKQRILTDADEEYLFAVHARRKWRMRKLVVKDFIYHVGKKLGMGKLRPKLQGGAFSLFREKFELVNGFDENYIGWGLEDDDLGRRMYLSRVLGFNISHKAWVYHLWHEHAPSKSIRPNKQYHRGKTFSKATIRAEEGLENSNCEEVRCIEVN